MLPAPRGPLPPEAVRPDPPPLTSRLARLLRTAGARTARAIDPQSGLVIAEVGREGEDDVAGLVRISRDALALGMADGERLDDLVLTLGHTVHVLRHCAGVMLHVHIDTTSGGDVGAIRRALAAPDLELVARSVAAAVAATGETPIVAPRTTQGAIPPPRSATTTSGKTSDSGRHAAVERRPEPGAGTVGSDSGRHARVSASGTGRPESGRHAVPGAARQPDHEHRRRKRSAREFTWPFRTVTPAEPGVPDEPSLPRADPAPRSPAETGGWTMPLRVAGRRTGIASAFADSVSSRTRRRAATDPAPSPPTGLPAPRPTPRPRGVGLPRRTPSVPPPVTLGPQVARYAPPTVLRLPWIADVGVMNRIHVGLHRMA